MQSLLETFFEAPTADNYLAARKVLLEEAAVDISPLFQLHDLVAGNHYEQAGQQLAGMMPAWGLSPRVHFLAAQISEAVNDSEDVELEMFCFHSCLHGLLATGDGTEQWPYQVTYLSDLYDVVLASGRMPLRQELASLSDRRLDRVVCTEGDSLVFDVTHLTSGASASYARRRSLVYTALLQH